MTNSLSFAIDHLASEFAASIIEAIRASSLADILEAPPPRGPSRSPARPRVTEKAPSSQPQMRGDVAALELFIAIRGKHHPGTMRAIRWFHSVHGYYPAAADMAAPWPVGSLPIRLPGRPRVTKAEDYKAVISYVQGHPGTTAELARMPLGMEKNRWSTCIARAIKDGKIRKEGELRSTRYWAV